MNPSEYESAFESIQQKHATSLLRDYFPQIENFGDLHSLLCNPTIGPHLKKVQLKDVLVSKSFERLKSIPTQRRTPTFITKEKRQEIKTMLVRSVATGRKSTSELSQLIQNKFANAPQKLAYKLMCELEQASMVHRVYHDAPLVWGIGPRS